MIMGMGFVSKIDIAKIDNFRTGGVLGCTEYKYTLSVAQTSINYSDRS